MHNTEETAKSLFDRFMKYYGIEEKDFLESSGVINLHLYGIKKYLFYIKQFINLGYYGFALSEMNDMIRCSIFSGSSISFKNTILDSDEELQKSFELLTLLRDITFNYKYWLNSEYQHYLDEFQEFQFIKNDNLNFKDIPSDVFSIAYYHSVSITKRTYVYQKGEDFSDMSNLPWVLYPKIIMSTDVNEWFTFSKKLSLTKQNSIVASLFLRIDEVNYDFSEFVIMISYKGNVWMIPIGANFVNPKAKGGIDGRHRSKLARKGEEKTNWEDFIGLPWYLVDKIDEYRKSTQKVSPIDLKGEYYFEEWSEQKASFVFYIYHLIKFSINEIDLNRPVETVTTLQEFVTNPTLLLEGQKFDGDTNIEDSDFSSWEGIREFYDDLISVLDDVQEPMGLVKASKSEIQKYEWYDKNWIGTTKDIEQLSRWLILDKKADVIKNKLKEVDRNKDRDWSEMEKLLSNNYDNILKLVTSAETGYMAMSAIHNVGFSNTKDKPFIAPFFHEVMKDKGLGYGSIQVRPKCDISNRKWRPTEQICPICEISNSSKYFIRISIISWKQICIVTGLKRSELPPYFRNYNNHQLIPYGGNSLLQQTNPIGSISDPMSRYYPNGMVLFMRMCGNCSHAFKTTTKKGYKMFDDNGYEIEYELNTEPNSHIKILPLGFAEKHGKVNLTSIRL